jgi:zinc protease
MNMRFLLVAFALSGTAAATAQTTSGRAAAAGDPSGQVLIDKLPAPGRVVSETTNPAVGLTEWRLSNGARVLVKPTSFTASEVMFTAYSVGGSSLVPDADYITASLAPTILQLGGLGRFNQLELDKKLIGTNVRITSTIGSTSEELSGSAATRDLQTLFELIHLSFTEPRVDLAAFGLFKNRIAPGLSNRNAEAVFNDSVTLTMAQHHVRARPLTAAVLNEADPDRALAIYRDRFADAGDFTFVFVGDLNVASLRTLSERYLANLPATGRRENWKDVEPAAPQGVVERTIRRGSASSALTQIFFHGPFQYSPQSRVVMRAMIELLQNRLTALLRTQPGYRSPTVQGGPSRIPRSEYLIRVEYECAPANVDKVAQSVLSLIDTLKTSGPRPADVERTRQQMAAGRTLDLRSNAYWLRNLAARDQSGEDPAGLLAPHDQLIRSVTPAMIRQAVQQYFDTTNFAKFILLPETG